MVKEQLKNLISKRHIDGLSGSILFDLNHEEYIFIDHKSGAVSFAKHEADCTIEISEDDLLQMVTGELDPLTAYMSGKLTVHGDMSIAMQLQSLLT